MTDFTTMTMEQFRKMAEEQVARRDEAIQLCQYKEGQKIKLTSSWGTVIVDIVSISAPFGYMDYNRWEVRATASYDYGYVSVGFNEHDVLSGAVVVEVLS